MIYKAFEYAADTAELENVLKFDQVTPILASAATGVFYKSTGESMVLSTAIAWILASDLRSLHPSSWSEGYGACWRSRCWFDDRGAVRCETVLPTPLDRVWFLFLSLQCCMSMSTIIAGNGEPTRVRGNTRNAKEKRAAPPFHNTIDAESVVLQFVMHFFFSFSCKLIYKKLQKRNGHVRSLMRRDLLVICSQEATKFPLTKGDLCRRVRQDQQHQK